MRRNRILKILRYDPDTGIFTRCKTGKVTGTIYPDGYVYLQINGNKYRADKVAWFLMKAEWPKHNITHINGVKSDNWMSNLKKERKIRRKDNRSGIPGVSWDKRDKVWRAQISINGKIKNMGNFKAFDQAVLARFKAEQISNPGSDTPASRYIKKMFM